MEARGEFNVKGGGSRVVQVGTTIVVYVRIYEVCAMVCRLKVLGYECLLW